MSERRALTEKMIEIRKKIDPRHLFQSSFRLLEEKWRKSCWPNLKGQAVIKKMIEFKKKRHPVQVTFFKVHSDYWKKNEENLVGPI
ncbi:hypothetical protein Glove_40g176 [Diversispora epigaea]|uniref:Uncharacterized protein n=1 Tax=Diversispora epigaea TaxID=1348612 RepID=A0A397JRM4_9GLOM|nr:hypothetical protein Glove_40g176 [Diversispora epigaea]